MREANEVALDGLTDQWSFCISKLISNVDLIRLQKLVRWELVITVTCGPDYRSDKLNLYALDERCTNLGFGEFSLYFDHLS